MSADAVVIRPESAAEFDAIRRVVSDAFEDDRIGVYVDDIRASQHYRPELSLVALVNDEVVGHVMIDGCWVRSASGDRDIVMLSPLAVAAPHRERGIATELISAALAGADRAGEPYVVLEGSPAFYGKRGFAFAGDFGLTLPLPDWAPREAAQVYPLSGYDPTDESLKGAVVYPDYVAKLNDN